MSVDVKPPSTQRFWPVMYDASGLSSNTMAWASFGGIGDPAEGHGLNSARRQVGIGVDVRGVLRAHDPRRHAIGPRMPSRASSKASCWHSVTSAAFDTASGP